MKTLFVSLLLLSVSLSANANTMHKVATCNAALMEGEYTVYLSADRKTAKVSYSGVEEYPVTKIYLGPVSSYDYVTSNGTERIIIAVDGGHELHLLNPKTGRFSKIASLTCN